MPDVPASAPLVPDPGGTGSAASPDLPAASPHLPAASPDLPPPSGWESLRVMWIFSLLRIAIFLALWGLLFAAKVPGFLAAMIALVLSIPLSFVLLRKPREQLAINLERRVQARRARTENLDSQLSGEDL